MSRQEDQRSFDVMVFHVHLLGLVPLVLYPDDYTSCQQQV